MMVPNLTQDYLVSRFEYDPATGWLVWKPKPPSENDANRWNARYANKRAGAVSTSRGLSYRMVQVFGKKWKEHRIIWLLVYGSFPDEADHINGDGLDNRLLNLRSVSRRENSKNLSIKSNNTSGVLGVYPYKGGWRAQIGGDNGRFYLGHFASVEEAASARMAAEVAHGYHQNHGRRQATRRAVG